jgi:hypothetical protein
MKSKKLFVWFFTYQETVNNSLPKAESFMEFLKDLNPKGYCVQLERGEESGRLHYQGNIRLTESMSVGDLRKKFRSKFHHESAHGIKRYAGGCLTLRPTADLKHADFYCVKDETRVEGPWMYPSNIYMGQDIFSYNKLYPWQRTIHDMIVGCETDPRAIHLVHDPGGGKGKSELVKMLSYNHDACVIPIGLSSAQMKSAIVDDGPNTIYLLDLPRNNKSYQDIFDTIEEIKRGFVISSFHGKLKKLYMTRPHIVCFTNEWPNLSHLSFDMWRLYEISSSTLELVPVDKFEIQRIQSRKNKYVSTYSEDGIPSEY